MDGFDWKEVGGALAALLSGALMALAARFGFKRGDGTPPADRQPTIHETKRMFDHVLAELAVIRDMMQTAIRDDKDRNRDRDDDHRRQFDRLAQELEAIVNRLARIDRERH